MVHLMQAQPHDVGAAEEEWEGNGKVIICSNLSEVPGTKGAKGEIIGKEKSVKQAKQNKLVGHHWTSEEGTKQIKPVGHHWTSEEGTKQINRRWIIVHCK